ncbi:hypothetical protein PHISCL_05936 [Aspergillus sclerotialis]|uniref:Uncharacterized protein n=1 Tax=Aspergillus sclerotialis TaxID=2070753 RepID=A0A3A2ZEY9_9EURO|nr:hypothetical protein PHISCL_05936 [Aspergillus sclerotialis]
MPQIQDLTFLFQISPVSINPDVPENRKFGGYWFPPETSEAFTIDTSNQTGWVQWNRGTHGTPNILAAYQPSALPSPSDHEEVCSIFFDSECGYFLVTPTDCSQTGSTDPSWDLGWKRLGFEHLDQGRLSKVTFVAEHHTLGGRGARQWMPDLLPESYNNHGTSEITGITGDLVLLVAMAAFTCEVPSRGDFLITMRDHFCPPLWIPRSGRTASIKRLPYCHKTGLVVKIRPVLGTPFQKDQLKDLENGRHGSVFAGISNCLA